MAEKERKKEVRTKEINGKKITFERYEEDTLWVVSEDKKDES